MCINHFVSSLILNVFSYLYWSTWGVECHIIQSNMDGTNQSVIVGKNHHLNSPNAITVDKTIDHLYWTEKTSIATIGLNGRNYKQILSGLQHPHDLAVFEDYVYWTDPVEKTINRANKFTGREREKLIGKYTDPLGIVISHPLTQTEGK